MHCILSDDGKDSNTAKGVNIAIEFKEYEDTFFKKKCNQRQNEKNSK